MVLALDGVSFDNPTRGWHLLRGTTARSGFSRQMGGASAAGRDGVTPGLPRPTGPAGVRHVFECRESSLEALTRLLRGGRTLTDSAVAGIQAYYENVDIPNPELLAPTREVQEAVYQVTAVGRLPEVFWRDTADQLSTPVVITSGAIVVQAFTEMSAPVRDSLIAIAGTTGSLVVASSTSSFAYSQAIPPGQYLRFECASGRAFVGANPWAGGAEVTQFISNGPGDYPFEIWPDSASGIGQIGVNASSWSPGSVVQVRGRRAYAR